MQESLDGVAANSKHRANSTFHIQNVFIVRVSAFEFRHKRGNNELAMRYEPWKVCVESEKKMEI